jgi:DNA-binding MarR family transcriptional regulator
MGELAERVGVHPSTLSRTVDRLSGGEWIERGASPESRREVIVSLSERGSALVADVTRKRRRSIAAVLRELPDAERAEVRRGMELFAQAAGEPASDDLLALGL